MNDSASACATAGETERLLALARASVFGIDARDGQRLRRASAEATICVMKREAQMFITPNELDVLVERG